MPRGLTIFSFLRISSKSGKFVGIISLIFFGLDFTDFLFKGIQLFFISRDWQHFVTNISVLLCFFHFLYGGILSLLLSLGPAFIVLEKDLCCSSRDKKEMSFAITWKP